MSVYKRIVFYAFTVAGKVHTTLQSKLDYFYIIAI